MAGIGPAGRGCDIFRVGLKNNLDLPACKAYLIVTFFEQVDVQLTQGTSPVSQEEEDGPRPLCLLLQRDISPERRVIEITAGA